MTVSSNVTAWRTSMQFHSRLIGPLYVQVTVHRDNLRINNQQDASGIQNVYFVTKLYMLRASTVPIIRSYQLYTWQLVCFMKVMWPLSRRVRLELQFQPDSPRQRPHNLHNLTLLGSGHITCMKHTNSTRTADNS